MRSKYGEYPEYHTSLDDLTLITPAGLRGAADVIVGAIQLLEKNKVYKATNLCEPQLGKRGLYPNTSNMQQDYTQVKMLTNLLAYADGGSDLLELADKIRANIFELLPLVESLEKAGLIKVQD
jgi:aminopeptidase-like protein